MPNHSRSGLIKRRTVSVCLSICPSVCRVAQHNSRTEKSRKPKIGRMEAHRTVNPWTYLEIKRSKVKVTRPINAWPESVSYLPDGKANEVQNRYTDGAQKRVSSTSAMTSKVKGQSQGRKVTWCIWQVLAHKSRTKRFSETPKLVGRLPT